MRGASTLILAKGTRLYRICRVDRGPLWFGPGNGRPPRHRFDAPDGSYGVCYLAASYSGAFVETFMRDPRAGDGRGRLLALSALAARHCVEVELTSALTVGALRGRGLSWRGLTASVSSSPLYDDTRSISAAIHSEAAGLAGIEYRCRHDDDEIAYALFDRARPHLRVVADSAVSCVEIAFSLHGHYPFVVTAED